MVSDGRLVLRVLITPAEFAEWCKSRGMEMNLVNIVSPVEQRWTSGGKRVLACSWRGMRKTSVFIYERIDLRSDFNHAAGRDPRGIPWSSGGPAEETRENKKAYSKVDRKRTPR